MTSPHSAPPSSCRRPSHPRLHRLHSSVEASQCPQSTGTLQHTWLEALKHINPLLTVCLRPARVDSVPYLVHTFGTVGTHTLVTTVPAAFSMLLVGGGGGGGGRHGGGGGAGTVLHITSGTLPAGTHTIVVGSGGSGACGSNTRGVNGGVTSISPLGMSTESSYGGGGGGGYNGGDTSPTTGRDSYGSGGGAGGYTGATAGITISHTTIQNAGFAGTFYASNGGACPLLLTSRVRSS